MTNNNNNSKPSLKAFLFIAVALLIAPFSFAIPSTASTNLQTSPGVSFQASGSTLAFTAPDKAVLNWNAFGSGTDTIGIADTIAFNLPNSNSSILNVVNGNGLTTIDGTLTSNAKVYILNPNGIVIGPSGRIEVPNLVLSTVDLPFSSQFQFSSTGKLPSETGTRTGGGNIAVNGSAIITGQNVTFLTKDIALNGGLINSNLTINADGAASIGSANNTTYISGNLVVNNASGNTVLGAVGGFTGSNAAITINATSGNITNVSGAAVSARAINLSSTNGDVNASGISASNLSVSAKNATVGLAARDGIIVSANVTGNLTVNGTNSFTIDGLKNSAGNTSIVSGGKLTLGDVHIDSNGTTSFTGTNILDSKDGVFVYGATAFNATNGDVAVTKADHSFGPLSISASGNAVVYESAAINLNSVRVRDLTLKTNQYFFQTPLTSSLTVEKLNLTTVGNVSFIIGTISNGLSVTSDGNVDLSRLSLSTNLNNIAPTTNAKGTFTPPAP